MKAYAYSESANAALVGPLFAHKVGDRVTLEPRTHPYLRGHELRGGVFEIARVDEDGMALGRRVEGEAA